MYIGKMIYTFGSVEVLPILCYAIDKGRCCINLKWQRYVIRVVLKSVEKEVRLV